ncbi:hypothetical protein J7T55_010597 [Diaporthe amygdali]|uniref:uncharacterized protein n=1 Tax=Phomopsis amygdali TaxID=1214568 RepID=UPI0022FF375E|nr:uncharacterized protein J7T55_010597 [Diaporthe amygdali]KAJ0115774.1 hypothetical protein J7T55_010597 [Diaporthe amygdali]
MTLTKAQLMALVAGAKKSPDNDKRKQFLKQLGPSKGGCTPDVAMAILDKLEGKSNALPVASMAGGPATAKLPARPAKHTGNPLAKTRPAPGSTTPSRVPSPEKARLPSASKKEQAKPALTAPGAAGKPAKKP